MTVNPTQFDPGRYLRKVNGSDYLEVKWRLLWLRTDHPDASVSTELMSHDGQMALFKATVSIPGGGSSTGWGSEQYNDFRDYIEKAETKAIGRALSALGYGTQFCPDFDFTGGTNKVVDAPIDIQRRGILFMPQLLPQRDFTLDRQTRDQPGARADRARPRFHWVEQPSGPFLHERPDGYTKAQDTTARGGHDGALVH